MISLASSRGYVWYVCVCWHSAQNLAPQFFLCLLLFARSWLWATLGQGRASSSTPSLANLYLMRASVQALAPQLRVLLLLLLSRFRSSLLGLICVLKAGASSDKLAKDPALGAPMREVCGQMAPRITSQNSWCKSSPKRVSLSLATTRALAQLGVFVIKKRALELEPNQGDRVSEVPVLPINAVQSRLPEHLPYAGSAEKDPLWRLCSRLFLLPIVGPVAELISELGLIDSSEGPL